jgi:hypothetical protein
MYAWISPDSTRVLGLGQTPRTAHADALSRHALAAGYCAEVSLKWIGTDGRPTLAFPASTNPLRALVAAMRAGCPPTLTERGADPAPVVKAAEKNGASKKDREKKADAAEKVSELKLAKEEKAG